jgi:hypothetical protein
VFAPIDGGFGRRETSTFTAGAPATGARVAVTPGVPLTLTPGLGVALGVGGRLAS